MQGLVSCFTRRRGGQLGRRAFRGLFSPKQGNKNFYKGRNAISLGKIDNKGRFEFDPSKLPEYFVPDLFNCHLKPYVAYDTPKIAVLPPGMPQLDLDQCEVDLERLLFGKKYQNQSAEVDKSPVVLDHH